MSVFKYDIGDTVTDIVTDYHGTITARMEDFNRSKSYLIEARCEKPGNNWFVEERLLLLKRSRPTEEAPSLHPTFDKVTFTPRRFSYPKTEEE